MKDKLVSLKAAIDKINALHDMPNAWLDCAVDAVMALPEYEELTPEEAASEIASGSTISAWYWLDAMVQLNQMGYVICRKR